MDLNPALQTFVAECDELLEQMEQSLLQLEHHPWDRELLDAVFRAAHTIKGSAGMFGFNAIVSFTHGLENLLDRVRAGEVALDSDLSALLLRCGDHIKSLVPLAVDDQALDSATIAIGESLTRQLGAIQVPLEISLKSSTVNELAALLDGSAVASTGRPASLANDKEVG